MPAAKSELIGGSNAAMRGLPKLLLLIVLCISGAPVAVAETPATAQREVLDVVTALFDAMREKDSAGLEKLFLAQARLGDNGVSSWIEQVGAGTRFLDEVTYDETVMVDDNLAMAWTPYTLYVDGVLHHCGVDIFVMRRVDAQWKILQLDDTRRKERCPDPQA